VIRKRRRGRQFWASTNDRLLNQLKLLKEWKDDCAPQNQAFGCMLNQGASKEEEATLDEEEAASDPEEEATSKEEATSEEEAAAWEEEETSWEE